MIKPPKFVIDLHGKPESFDNAEQLIGILNKLDNNPFGKVELMDLEGDYEFNDKINWDAIFEKLSKGPNQTVQFRGTKPFPYVGNLATVRNHTYISFMGARASITPEKPKEIISFIQDLILYWDGFMYGSAAGHHDIKEINKKAKEKNLVEMFHATMHWVHFLAKEKYEENFERDDFLKGPFHSVSEDEKGTITFFNYEDPLNYEDKNVLKKINETSSYIKSKQTFNKQ